MAALKRNFALLLSAGAVALAACSGGSTTPNSPTPGNASLSISYSALTVKTGETVSLAANLQNSTDAVKWALAGGGSLSETSGAATTYQAPGSPCVASISASAAGLTSKVDVNVVTPGGGDGGGSGGGTGGGSTTVTVRGTVLNEDGDPVENQAVHVLGNPSTLTSTDLEGKFTIANVTTPYHLVMTEDHLNRVFVYKDLTTDKPTLYVFEQEDQTAVPTRKTRLIGPASGGDGFPFASSDPTFLGFASSEVAMDMDLEHQNWDSALNMSAVHPFYSLDVTWTNASPVTTGTLVAAQYRPDPATGAPLQWWYAAQPGVTLLGNQTIYGPALTLMPVEAANTEGTISLPPLYSVYLKSLGLSLEGGVFVPVFDDLVSLSQQGSFKYIAPEINGASTQVCAEANDTVPAFNNPDVGTAISATCIDALAPQTPAAKLEIVAAPNAFNPVNGAEVITYGTPFAWSKFKGGVHLIRFYPANYGSKESLTNEVLGPSVFVITENSSTTIPDVSSVTGMVLHGAYYWDVIGFGPFKKVDDFVAGIPAAALFDWWSFVGGFANPGQWGQKEMRPVPSAFTAKGIHYRANMCFAGCY